VTCVGPSTPALDSPVDRPSAEDQTLGSEGDHTRTDGDFARLRGAIGPLAPIRVVFIGTTPRHERRSTTSRPSYTS
jgi:hypothetical protein